MDIYNVIPDGYYMYIEDFEEEDRKRMNCFFKENYGFEFKDINGKAFNVQLQNALYATHRNVDIIILMARRALNGKKRNYDNWSKAVNYD